MDALETAREVFDVEIEGMKAVRDALESGKLGGDFSVYLLTEQGAASAMTRAEAFKRIPADRETHLVFTEFKRFFER